MSAFLPFSVILAVVAYVAMIIFAGYYVSTFTFLSIMYPIVSRVKDGKPVTVRGVLIGLSVSVVVTVLLYIIFSILLKVRVPDLLIGGL